MQKTGQRSAAGPSLTLQVAISAFLIKKKIFSPFQVEAPSETRAFAGANENPKPNNDSGFRHHRGNDLHYETSGTRPSQAGSIPSTKLERPLLR